MGRVSCPLLGTAFGPLPGSAKLTMPDVTDGGMQTSAVVEAAEAVPWTKPEDLPYAPDRALTGLGSQAEEKEGLAVFVDASVRLVSRRPGISVERQMRTAITRDGGEP